jgi:muramoyltetrapeptide carboxypeptidase LdcA involved in peptidoglycan recycling
MIKPPMLQPGDCVAVVSLSSGDAASHPVRYNAGKKQLEDEFGLRVVETPHALRDEEWISKNPQGRAEDLMGAFADPEVKAIVAASGGDDSVRLLPFYDFELMRRSPKAFIGHSDTTISHFACFHAGLVSFYGSNLMSGFAENGGICAYLADSVLRTLFSSEPIGLLHSNTQGWTREETDWDDEQAQAHPRQRHASHPWRWLQGSGKVQGPLIGGCLEILELLRGTEMWPEPEAWKGAVLFLETSDEEPGPEVLTRASRVYARLGILENLSAILLGRPGGLIPTEHFDLYERALMRVVKDEEGLDDLPVVSRMDFGHTDPVMLLPLGVQAQVDCEKQQISILESAVT